MLTDLVNVGNKIETSFANDGLKDISGGSTNKLLIDELEFKL